MNIELVDSYIIEVLKSNGWYFGRKYDPTFWINQLEKEGYSCFTYARDILEEMGGIEINIGNQNGYLGAQFDFNPYNVASGEFDRLERFEVAAGEKLYPIGSMIQAITYVGTKNNIFVGDWNSFLLVW